MFRRSLLALPLLAAPILGIAGCAQNQPATTTSTTVVFFTADSALIDRNGETAVMQAATLAKQRPNATVHVRGFAAPDAGSPAFNRSLSRTRAEAVADQLVNDGVPRIQLSMETRGAVAYDLMPTESRRVEIVVGP